MSHDDKGIVWFPQVAPFDVHLIELPEAKRAEEVYQKLTKAGIEVLWDERDLTAGEKFADADLIGIPVRLVVSQETKDKLEWKKREREKTELMSLERVIKRLSSVK